MIEDIEKVIERSLPAEVGKQLRRRLEDADRYEKLYMQTDEEVSKYRVENAELKKEITAITNLVQRKEDIAKKEHDLEIRDAVLATEEEAVKIRRDDIYSLVKMLFSNTTVRKSTMKAIPVAQPEWVSFPTTSAQLAGPDRVEQHQETEEITEE